MSFAFIGRYSVTCSSESLGSKCYMLTFILLLSCQNVFAIHFKLLFRQYYCPRSRKSIQSFALHSQARTSCTFCRDEFTNYMFLQRSEAADDNVDNWRFFPQDFKDRNDNGTSHRDTVEFLLNFEQGDKYITCGRDGTFRLWNSSDLKHFRTVGPHGPFLFGEL